MPSLSQGSGGMKLLPSPGESSFGTGKRLFIVMAGLTGVILLFLGGTYIFAQFFGGEKAPAAPVGITTNSTTNTTAGTTATADDAGDPDADGLTNAQERQYGTDAAQADTDGDTYKDGEEVRNGFNPKGTGALPSQGRF